MKPLQDVSAERAVLAAICQYGEDVYLDVIDMLQESTFTIEYNQLAFSTLKQIFKHGNVDKVDFMSILSAASEIGLESLFEDSRCQNHIRSLLNCSVSAQNARRFAAKIRKFEVTRLLQSKLQEASSELNTITGDESMAQILSIAEGSILDFSSLLTDNEATPKRISEGLIEYVDYLGGNPLDQVGIATSFPLWDASIGGGLRRGTLNLIGARSGCGKSILGSNMGYYIANQHNIPVLNMDTEMTQEDHTHRFLAMACDAFIYDIETGKFSKKPNEEAKIKRTAAELEQKKLPYFHKPIAGMPFEEQLAILRRWVIKEVGLESDGKAKPCVIVYDYLKLMTADGINGALQEYQLLGFMMTTLHNFAVHYGIPILMFIQLNRDGVDKESTAAASGSDRIIWLCSNFTIFKEKSPEEMEVSSQYGTHKLVVLKQRHGRGRHYLDYINCHFRGDKAMIKEGQNAFAVKDYREPEEPKDDIKF